MVTALATSEVLAAEPHAYRPLLPVHLRRAAVVVILVLQFWLCVMPIKRGQAGWTGRWTSTPGPISARSKALPVL